MPQRWKVHEPLRPHFITCTVVHLIPVFFDASARATHLGSCFDASARSRNHLSECVGRLFDPTQARPVIIRYFGKLVPETAGRMIRFIQRRESDVFALLSILLGLAQFLPHQVWMSSRA